MSSAFAFLHHLAAFARDGDLQPPKILNTQPVTQDRMDRLAAAIERGGHRADGPRTPLPEAVRAAVAKKGKGSS